VKDYYDVLCVDRDASSDDIRRAYRYLARRYHPDANLGDATAEEAFKEVAEAYSVLGRPPRRRQYDDELGLSRRQGFYEPREPAEGVPVARFAEGTPLRGMRIVRKYGRFFLDVGDEMAAVAVLEFDRLGQLEWEGDVERGWVLAEALGQPVDTADAPASPATARAGGQATRPFAATGTPRPQSPFYANPRARGLVKKARHAVQQGRFDAALEMLEGAEPSARLGDAEVADGIVEVARSIRAQVSGDRRAACDELLTHVGAVHEGAGSESAAANRPRRGPSRGGRLSWLRRTARDSGSA
jgi:hypothetical protein